MFQQFQKEYMELYGRYQAGQLSQERFCQAIDRLRLQDGQGNFWQLSYDGQWLCWNGTQWAPGKPSQSTGPDKQYQAAAGQVAESGQKAYQAAQPLALGDAAKATGKVVAALRPLAGKSERWWSLVSILGGGIGGGLWYFYSTLDKGARPDPVTALIMVVVPVVLAVFRKPLDRMLAVLNTIRQKLPKLVIVGVGIAAPYLTATYLYDIVKLQNYPYIRWTVFLGPILSYMIIRTPRSR